MPMLRVASKWVTPWSGNWETLSHSDNGVTHLYYTMNVVVDVL